MMLVSRTLMALLLLLLGCTTANVVPFRHRTLQTAELQEGETCVTGFIMDTYCIQRGRLLDNGQFETLKNPEQHSLHCLVDVSFCVSSGFEVLTPPVEGSDEYVRAAKLDEFGTNECVLAAQSIGDCSTCETNNVNQKLGFAATVIGTLDETVDPPLLSVRQVLPESEVCPQPLPLQCPPGFINLGGACACFSGGTKVQTDTKGIISMDSLEIGDMVHIGDNIYDQVYSFAHYSQDIDSTYVVINDDLEISPNHMVRVLENGFVPASTIKVGDQLVAGSGGSTVVVKSVTAKTARGMFAPMTRYGTIVVNGIVASTFVTMQQDSATLLIGGYDTGVTWQFLSNKFEVSRRMYCAIAMMDCSKNEVYTTNGIATWAVKPRNLVEWMNRQSVPLSGLCWVVVLSLVFCVSMIEFIVWGGVFLAAMAVLKVMSDSSRHSKTKLAN